MSTTDHRCEICGHSAGNETFSAREMTFGLRHPFDYFECTSCGCVQIVAVPDNLGEYYPDEYFAFKSQHRLARSRWRAMIDKLRFSAAMADNSVVGRIANGMAKPLNYVTWAQAAGVDRSARVLDIGCGAGKLLVRMRHAGFKACTGVDPFIRETLNYANGVTVHACELSEFVASAPEPYDFIMMHHSLEHMPRQLEVLSTVRSVLADGGKMLIRIPVAGGFAWRQFKENWINLDPPRHLYLHTERSIARLAADAGLEVMRCEYDSTERQLLGSELWARDIAWLEQGPQRADLDARKPEFAARAVELNAANDGDMAAFYLRQSAAR